MGDRPTTLEKARELTGGYTPMKTDCGELCGARCCLSESGDGMILLPGEAELCPSGSDIRRINGFDVLVCSGSCDREARPFACRIFPLAIYIKEGKASIRLDPLARSVCPLSEGGIGQLSSDFTSAAKKAAKLLLAEPDLREHFEKLSRLSDMAFDSPLFDAIK